MIGGEIYLAAKQIYRAMAYTNCEHSLSNHCAVGRFQNLKLFPRVTVTLGHFLLCHCGFRVDKAPILENRILLSWHVSGCFSFRESFGPVAMTAASILVQIALPSISLAIVNSVAIWNTFL